MRHTVHMMLGKHAEQMILAIKKYIIKYGSEEEISFFNAMLYRKDSDGAGFYDAQLSSADTSTFVSGIDNLYNIILEENYLIGNENRSEYLKDCFTNLYSRKITINNPGDSSKLHVCFYLPVYKQKYWELIQEFLSVIDDIPQQYEVDLFLLPSDLAFLFEKDDEELPLKMKEYEAQTKLTIQDILATKHSYKALNHLILVQNCNANGLSLNLNDDSFVRIVGEFALLTVNHYYEIFNISALDKNRPIHALGLSVLSFDKYYFVQYLLHKTYLHILDREKIMQEKVDVNKVSQIVQDILNSNVKVFSNFYEKQVKPRLVKKIDQDTIITQIQPELEKEIERLTNECQAYMDSEEISLPEKKATLAQLLGEDDDLLTGYMFNKSQLVVEDCSREVLDFFVEANNSLFNMKDSSANKDSEGTTSSAKSIAEKAVLSKDTHEAVTLPSKILDDIKSTKISMRESSNYIRLKSAELEELGEQIHEHSQSQKRLTKDGFIFEGITYQLQSNIIEKPLEENYSPHSNLPGKVDLRESFTPIKSQGSLGACSAFAMVSIYEYILRKNQKQNSDLSEAFVYYNVRKRNNEEGKDSGSSLHDIVVTMGTEGVCTESFCPYTVDANMAEPSEEAYADASQRKIVKALNVQKDLQHIKSAVADGFPVAVSLRIYDSFTPEDGFISRPSQEEIDSEESGNHAMVVCGYSEEDRVFVVRNSWGEKFGDKGYCYIPYSYFEDFLNVACIVTEISTSDVHVGGVDSKITISFDMKNSRIKTRILNNLIDEEKYKLSKNETVLQNQEFEYNKIVQALGNNSNRSTICEGTIERMKLEKEAHSREKGELDMQRTLELAKHRKNTLLGNIYFCSSFALFILVYVILLFGVEIPAKELFFNTASYITYAVLVLDVLAFSFWMWYRKREYRELDEDFVAQMEQEEKATQDLAQQLEIIKLKSHIAGMIIDSLSKLYHNLHSKYNGMRSYVLNLKGWHDEERVNDEKMINDVRDPFLSLISNECLDAYFEKCKDKISENIRLYKMFKNSYHIEDEDVIRFKNNLKETLVTELYSKLDDFSIYKHIAGECTYDYLDRKYTDLDTLLQLLDLKSNHFVRTLSSVVSSEDQNSSCKLLFINTDFDAQRVKWKSICEKDFQVFPNLCKDKSQFKVSLLQLNALEQNQIALLQNVK